MSKRVYISADYAENDGDRSVVEELHFWASNNSFSIDFVDTAEVSSASVSDDPDCRPCDLKSEFNSQINASSAVIFVVGDKTAFRTAGSGCSRALHGSWTSSGCTPYKQNANGTKSCKYNYVFSTGDDVRTINTYSYLRHEFEQAKKRDKKIIIVYNSLTNQSTWLPSYMDGYEIIAQPFWIISARGNRIGNYAFMKQELGF